MVFSSHLFVYYFLPLALVLYFGLPQRARNLALTLLSYAFYGWANPAFVVLMMASTVIDYFCGLTIADGWRAGPVGLLDPEAPRRRRQRVAVAISVAANLSLLGFFKYFNFGVESYNSVLVWLGLGDWALDSVIRIALPLGISFYTFQSMSYTIDVYRGDARALRNFVDFACYVSMFPQLVAGPIVRFSEISDQLSERTHTLEKFARGVALLALGLTKKVALANPCGKVADSIFDAGSVGALDAWYGAVAYSMQIYFDFSGYSDMAIGLGLMLGFVFSKNFDSPYRAESITDFWRRWHISLSSWLRDYLYRPLGGNRRGARRTYLNLALVMLLGGLWHGAAWKFIAWGGLHGLWLALERMRGKSSLYSGLPRPLRVGATFLLICLSWVFFRASDLSAAVRHLGAMTGLIESEASAALISGVVYQPYYLLSLFAALVIAFVAPQSWDWTRTLTPWKAAVCLLFLWLSLGLLGTQAYNPFIYFIF